MQKRNSYDPDIINFLKDKFDVSKSYIEKSIRGDSNSIVSILILDEYNKKRNEILKVKRQTLKK